MAKKLLKKGGKLVKKKGKLVATDSAEDCDCCGTPPPPPPDPECPPESIISVTGESPDQANPPTIDDYCKRAETRRVKVKVPDHFKLPCRVSVSGGVDDDISIDGTIIEEGRYPYGNVTIDGVDYDVKCNRGHMIGLNEPGTQWVFETSNREFEVYAIDNIYGGVGFGPLTFCFGVKEPLSQWPKKENPFP